MFNSSSWLAIFLFHSLFWSLLYFCFPFRLLSFWTIIWPIPFKYLIYKHKLLGSHTYSFILLHSLLSIRFDFFFFLPVTLILDNDIWPMFFSKNCSFMYSCSLNIYTSISCSCCGHYSLKTFICMEILFFWLGKKTYNSGMQAFLFPTEMNKIAYYQIQFIVDS